MRKKQNKVNSADIVLLKTNLLSIRMDARNNITLHLIIPSVNALETSEMIKACNRGILTLSTALIKKEVHKKMAAKVLHNLAASLKREMTEEDLEEFFKDIPIWLYNGLTSIDKDISDYLAKNKVDEDGEALIEVVKKILK